MKTSVEDEGKQYVIFTDFNKSVASRIVSLVGKGMFPGPAARACGVTERVWTEWWDRGVNDLNDCKNTEFSRFIVSIEASEARLESEIVKSYFKSAKMKPADCAKFLAQRFPTRWNPNTPATGTGAQQVVNINVVKYQLPSIEAKARKVTVGVTAEQLPGHAIPARKSKLPASADGGFVPKSRNMAGDAVPYKPADIEL